jgi:hypothetical protein
MTAFILDRTESYGESNVMIISNSDTRFHVQIKLMCGQQLKQGPIVRNLYNVHECNIMFRRKWIQELLDTVKHSTMKETENTRVWHGSGDCELHVICDVGLEFILITKPEIRHNNLK